jgi:hypothetical protein
MQLDLSDVTVCAVDSVNVALTARALHLSMVQCKFADAILFTHATVHGGFRTEKIPRVRSTAQYSSFCFKQLPTFIETPFVLIVQWDGYLVNPGAWSPVFRQYDYIGARWPSVKDGWSVGNGGFSLRSRKFLSALTQPRFALDVSLNSDWVVCRSYRPELERDYGVRFAPEHVADLFSHETAAPSGPTFGFHGLQNMWRYVDDGEMVKFISFLNADVCRTEAYARLILAYFDLGSVQPLSALYLKMRRHLDRDQVWQAIKQVSVDQARAAECIRMCETLSPSRLPESLERVRRKARKALSLLVKSWPG